MNNEVKAFQGKSNTFFRALFIWFVVLVIITVSSFTEAQHAFGAGTVYDAFNDFSWISNPTQGGIWRYGYSTSLGGPLNLYQSPVKVFGLSVWQASPTATDPNLLKNETGQDITDPGNTVLFPSTQFLHFHPGPNREFSVVRWTAPMSGVYQIDATFKSLRFAGQMTTTDVHVIYNSTPIFNGLINGFISSGGQDFLTNLDVSAGDTIDFVVGVGENNNFGADSTGLRATITLENELPTDTPTMTPQSHQDINVVCGDVNGLINAITLANNETTHPGSDTINLATTCTYELESVNNFTYAPNGLPYITSEIIIDGNGSTISRKSGAEAFRFIDVAPTGKLTIQNLIMTNGDAGGGIGGAVHVFGTLEVDNSTFTNNTASSAGAIDNNSGVVNILGSSFIGNHTTGWGGAMSVDGTTIIRDSIFTNNAADRGGAISTTGGELQIYDSIISNNQSASLGGGIFSYSDLLYISGTNLTSNRAGYIGGGLFNSAIGPATIVNTRFQNNLAVSGAAVINYSTPGAPPQLATMNGNCIVGNSANSVVTDLTDPKTNARGNWWGSSDGPSGEGPGSGDTVLGNIDYSGFLTAPPANCGVIQPPEPGTVFDAFEDFSWISNPTSGGIWQYGFTTSIGGPFTLYQERANTFGLSVWKMLPNLADPNVEKNDTGQDFSDPGNTVLFPSTEFLHFHPGPNREFSVVRWTAPATGPYAIDTIFKSLRNAGQITTTDVHVLHNSMPIYNGVINGYITSQPLGFSTILNLMAGDTIDFVVGVGDNNDFGADSTGLKATITFQSSIPTNTPTPVPTETITSTPTNTPSPTVTSTPTMLPPGFVPAGYDVIVQPIDPITGTQPVTLHFSQVTQSGMATLSINAIGSGGGAPGRPVGFKFGSPPTYYEISTTAVYSGPIELCFSYSGIQYNNESQLELWHLANGHWEQITTTLDTVNNVICGITTSLSPFAILEPDQPPTVGMIEPNDVLEGDVTYLEAYGNDPEGDPLVFAWDLDNDGIFETEGRKVIFSAALMDGPTTRFVRAKATDSSGLFAVTGASINILNAPPVIGTINAPLNPLQVGSVINASASFTDKGVHDSHIASWTWGDGTITTGNVVDQNGSGSVSGSHAYSTAGVYTITLTVTDDDGDSDHVPFQYVVAFDPGAGFVTGGGWINSPAGAYTPNSSLSGKATFGFVSKYQKGATVPTGQTQFSFSLGNFSFQSTDYQWLVIAGVKAMYKGSGAINGAGNYGFILTAIDGQANGGSGPDKFRIKIWDKSTGLIVYDNQMGSADDADPITILGGGSITIHK